MLSSADQINSYLTTGLSLFSGRCHTYAIFVQALNIYRFLEKYKKIKGAEVMILK
jgi:hypothetical protein